ncbi:hypothetical protein ACFSC3_19290 [Sphingomonas floccifaciens]|uniref:Uncharacterized protein n=1 Tax=Sphingomonas floccifaciens TaxID=1844115 RepID=A0ABW4NJF9_9SPHN
MELDAYARALGAAQLLVPSYNQLRLQGAQIRGAELDNQQQTFALDQAQQAQRAAVDQQARSRLRQQQIDADVAAFNAKPTSDGAVRLMTTYPELRNPIKDAWGMREAAAQKQQLSTFVQIKSALANGQPDVAIARIQRHIEADKASGGDTTDDENMIDMIRKDPVRFAASLDGLIAAVSGPEKFGDNAKALADTTKTIGDNRRRRRRRLRLTERWRA